MNQSNQPTQAPSKSYLEEVNNKIEEVNEKIVATLADFFQWGDLSEPVANMNFLLNEFITSESFSQYEKEQIQDVVFRTTFTIDILTKLYELFERREKMVLEKLLSGKVYTSKNNCDFQNQ